MADKKKMDELEQRKNEQQPTRHVIERVEPGEKGQVGGRIEMSGDVVATVAGLAARDIPGIHALGRSRLLNFGEVAPTHGVAAEVGQKEAALDVDLIIEYGCDIHKTANSLRAKVAEAVYQMTGRNVVEVNINVIDIHLPEPEKPEPSPEPQRRVQ